MHREDENPHIRSCYLDLAYCLEPVEERHPDIKDSYVRMQLLCLIYRFPAGCSLADNSPAALSVEEAPYATPNELVVISHEDAKFLGASSHLRVSVSRSQYVAPETSGKGRCRPPVKGGSLPPRQAYGFV